MQLVLKLPSRRIIIVVLAIVALVNIVFWMGGPRIMLFFQTHSLTFSSQWEAVYLANGDVLVGKIRGYTPEIIKLSQTYLVQAVKIDQAATTVSTLRLVGRAGGNLSLLRWGFSQPLKSKGELFISRSPILFWEVLDHDSEVVQELEKQFKK